MATKTEIVTQEFKHRIDAALAFAIEAGIRLDPLFDYLTNRIEAERVVLAARTPAEEARRRWESIGYDEPPSAILDLDRFPEITRDEEHPEYGLERGLPPRKQRRVK
jgi:hypothetical protein